MAFVRLIIVIAVGAALWLAAAAGGHGPAAHAMPHDHDAPASVALDAVPDSASGKHCCAGEADLGAPCQTLLAIAPICAAATAHVALASISLGRARPLPTGREPLGLLHPPQPV
ncbi:MAG: hypothetical protein ACU0CO_15230 [Shimia sp.]